MGDFVKINMSNSQDSSMSYDKKFPKDIKIVDLKHELEGITGGCAGTMKLELFNGDNLIAYLNNDEALLGSYPIDNGMRLHIIADFQLLSEDVAEFELNDKQYDQKRLAQEKKAEAINVGDRCLVIAKGTVRYKGPLDGKSGIYVGVEFDKPLDMHDGCVNGKRYFTCAPKYGSIAPVMSVEIGDFPPEELDLDEEI